MRNTDSQRALIAPTCLLPVLAFLTALVAFPVMASASSADVLINMTVNPNPVIAGANVTYHLTASNNGPDNASNVTVTDALPASLTFVSATPSQGTCSGTTTVTCSLGGIAFTGSATVDVIATTTAAGTVTNTASITATEPDPDTTNNSVTKAVTVNVGADVGLSISASPSPVIAGGTLTYTITASNDGPSSATNVVVNDPIPAGTAYTSASGTGWTCVAGPPISCSQSGSTPIGTLPAITVAVKVTSSSGTITNAASISATQADPNSANNTATINTTITPGADVQLTYPAPTSPVAVAGAIVYTLTPKNNGPGTASSLVVTDTLSADVTFGSVAQTGGWSCGQSGAVVTCTLATLASGASGTITINTTAATAGTAVNSANITATSADPTPANNNPANTSTVISAPGADLTFSSQTLTPSTPVAGGSNVKYNMTVKNNGPSSTSGVITVTDTLAAQLTYVSGVGTGWTCGNTGQTVTCTYSGVITSGSSMNVLGITATTASGSNSISNTPCVAVSNDNVPGNNCVASPTVTSTSASADLAISETAAPVPVLAGGTLTYTITVTNNGSSDATSVTVSDSFTYSSFISATTTLGSCGTGTTSFTCPLGTLTNGSSATITLNLKPTSATTGPTNTVSVSSSAVGDPNTANNSAALMVAITPAANLALTHTATPQPVYAGSNLTYVLTAKNNGPFSATNVTISDTLPAGVTYVSATPSAGSCSQSSGVVTCVLGGLANNGQATATVIVTPNSAGSITATATVSATEADPNTADNTASATSTVVAALVDVQVTKYGTPNPVALGGNVSYAITVHNSGPSTATGVVATDTPMTQFTFVSVSSTQGSCSGTSPIVCNLGTVPVNVDSIITLVMTASTVGTFSNHVAVTSNEADSNSANNTADEASTSRVGADLSVTESASPASLPKDATTTYTMVVSNAGPVTSVTTALTDALPAGLTFVSAASTQGACTGTTTVTCNFGSMASGTSATVTLVAAANTVGSISNSVSVSGSEPDPNPANNSATAAITVTSVADMTITKTHAGNFKVGDVGDSYSITVTNSGGAATTAAVSVTDTLPSSLTPSSAAGTGWTCGISAQTVTCTRSDALAAAGAYPAISITVNVATNAPASVTNTATVSGGGEVNTVNDSASDVAAVAQEPDLTLTKTHTGNFSQGQVGATFTITVSNIGAAATAATVTVTDSLPSDLTPISGSGTGWTCGVASQALTCTRAAAIAASSSAPAITLTVNVSPSAAASVTNTVNVSVAGEVITNNNSATDVVSVGATPDLTVSKSHTGNFTQGQQGAAYTVVVSNIGSAASTGTVTMTDAVPTGLMPVSGLGGGWSCSVVSQTVTCTRADALASAAAYPSLTVTVNVASTASASLTNLASVSGGGELNTANDSASDITTVNAASDLTLSMTNSGGFSEGGSGSYVLTPHNVGGGSTTGAVTVTDVFPAGVTPATAAGSGWTCTISGQTVNCNRSDALVPAGDYPTISMGVNFSGNVSASVVNTATVTGGGEVNTSNDSASNTSAVSQLPDMTVAITHSGSFSQGGSGTYIVTASNGGGAASSGLVTVTTTLPTGITASATTGTGWSCSVSGQTVTCTRSDALPAAASYAPVTIAVTIASTAAPSLITTANVSGGSETNTSNDSTTDSVTITGVPDMTITLAGGSGLVQGGSGTFSATAQNIGGVASSGTVTVADTFPTGLTPTAASGSGWSCSVSAQTASCTRTDVLNSGAAYPAVSIAVNAANNAASSYTDTASVAGGGEVNTANDSAASSVTVGAGQDLNIALTANGTFVEGQSGSYTIVSSNVGGAPTAGAVTISDVFPAGLTPSSATGTGWSCSISGQTMTCTRSDAIAASASYPAIAVAVNIGTTAAAGLSDTASVAGGGDVNPANNSASQTTAVTLVPDLTLAMTATTFVQGGSGTYTLTATNSGGGPSSGNITLADTLPTGVAAAATATGSGWTCTTSGATVNCTNSNAFAAGATLPAVSIPVTLSTSAPATISNTATVGGGGETNLSNDAATLSSPVGAMPDLTVAINHTGSFTQGSTGAYVVTASNIGSASSSGQVTITATLPAGITVTSQSGTGWSCTGTAQTVTCTRSDALAAAGSYPIIDIAAHIANNASGTLSTTATVAGGGEVNTANDSATTSATIGLGPDLNITLTPNGTFAEGQPGSYTIVSSNVGGTPTAGTVTISDVFPAGFTPTSATGTGWSCSISGQTMTCTRSDSLAASASYSAISAAVTIGATAAASLSETATVAGGGDVNPANNSASQTTAVTLVPDLTLAMTATSFVQGGSGTYTLTPANGGGGATSGTITLTDTLPTGVTAAAAATGPGWTCTTSGAMISCTNTNPFAAGATLPAISIPVTLSTSAPATISNTATVGGGGETNVSNDGATLASSVVATPDLTVAINHSGSFTQGGTGTYAVTASNVGSASSSGQATVTVTLPAGITVSTQSATGWTCAGTAQTVSCTRSDALAAGSSYPVITINAHIANNASSTLSTSATVSGGGEVNTANDSATISATIGLGIDLALTLTAGNGFTEGETGSYLVAIANVGGAPSSGIVTVADTLPSGFTPTGASGTGWQCALSGQIVTCSRSDSLSAGSSYPTFAITGAIAGNAPASISNTATLSGGGDVNPANNSSTVSTSTTIAPDLALTMGTAGHLLQGGNGSYLLTAHNIGGAPTSGLITVRDDIPSGASVTSASGSGWSCTFTNQAAVCTRSDVLAFASSYPVITLAVSVAPESPSPLVNLAVIAGGAELNTSNDTASIVSTVTGVPDLTLAKSHTGTFTAMDPGIFLLTVTNIGGASTAGAVAVTDTLPAGLTAGAATGTHWICTATGQIVTCTCTDSLSAGSSYPPIRLPVATAPSVAGTTLTNTAIVAGGGDQNTANNQAQDTTQVAAIPDLSIAAQATAPFVKGSSSGFAIVVSNNSATPTDGTAVSVSETLPAGLVATQASGVGWACTVIGQSLTCQRSDRLLARQNYSPINVLVQVTSSAPAAFSVVSTVAGGGDQSPSNDQTTTSGTTSGAPDLTIAEALQGNFRQLSTGTYVLTVSNVGPAPTDGSVISVKSTLPAGLTPASASGVNWTCSIATQTVTCTRSDVLAPGSAYPPISVQINVAVSAGPNLTSNTSVSGGGETNLQNDSVAQVISILPAQYPDLVVTLSQAQPFTQGGTGAYTAIISNQGPIATIGQVTVSDTLPPGLSFASVSGHSCNTGKCNGSAAAGPGAFGSGWSCSSSGSTVTCVRSDSLAAGAQYPAITIPVNVAPDAPLNLQDSITVQGGGEINVSNDEAATATPIIIPPLPKLKLTETADRSSAQMGDVITYTAQATDASSVPAKNLQLQILLPPGFRYIPGSAHVQVGATAAQPIQPTVGGSQLTFSLSGIASSGSITTVYRARIGAQISSGGHTDMATLTGIAPTGQKVGPVSAQVSVGVGESSLISQRPLLGRVFADQNHNDLFDQGDVPLPGVRIFLSDGQSATTDSEGLYSIPAVGDGSIAVSIDPITIPAGFSMSNEGERSSEGYARVLRTPLGGGTLLRQNFALQALPGAELPKRPDPAKSGIAGATALATSNGPNKRPTELVPDSPILPGDVLLLAPATQTVTAPKADFTIAVAREWSTRLELNGHPVAIGKSRPLVQDKTATATYTIHDVQLAPGPNKIRVFAVSPHGLTGKKIEAVIYRGGPVRRIEILPAVRELNANGRDSTPVTVRGYDAWDKPAADSSFTLETSQGGFILPRMRSGAETSARAAAGATEQAPALDLHNIGAGASPGGTGNQLLGVSGGASPQMTNSGVGGAGTSTLGQAINGSSSATSSVTTNSATPVWNPAALVNQSLEHVSDGLRQSTLSFSNGEAVVRLKASSIPGGAELRAYTDNPLDRVDARAHVAMTPELRSPILVGLGELSFGQAAPEHALFNQNSSVERRTQFFYQGKLAGTNLLTLAYSSHSALNDTSGYNRMFEMDPTDQQYIVFGDSSTRSYNALSNNHIYGRLDNGLSYLMFGDLRGNAAAASPSPGLTAFERSITGLKLHLESRSGASATFTGARPNTAFARDIFPGNILGLITLSHGNVLPGSQVVTLETRDRRNPALVLSRETLVQTADYTMDPLSGAIFFLRSISALDQNLNLTQIVVDYEYQAVGLSSSVYTARADERIDSIGLRLGLSFLNDRQGNNQSYLLGGIEGDKKLPRGGLLTFEVPVSHGTMTTSGTAYADDSSAAHNGTAIRADLQQPLGILDATLRASLTKTGADFLNPFGSTVVPGQQLSSASIEMKPLEASRLQLGFTDERNKTVNVNNHRETVSAAWKQNLTKRIDLKLGYDYRDLTDTMADRLVESNMLTLGADLRVTTKLQASLQREQNLGAADPTYPTETVLSAKYQLSTDTKLFYTQRLSSAPIIPIADLSAAGFASLNTTTDLAVGIETRVRKDTSFGARYEIDNGINGTDAFAVLGVVNRLPVDEKTSIDFGMEHGLLLQGKGHDFNSGTAAVSWKPDNFLRLTGRYELRDQFGFASIATAGLAGRITSGVTALGQVELVRGTTEEQRTNLYRAIGALAIRPLKTDRAGLLFSYNEQSGSGLVLQSAVNAPVKVDILSMDAWWQASKRLEFYTRFATSNRTTTLVGEPDVSTLSYLSQQRVQFRFAKYFDAAAEQRWLFQPDTATSRNTIAVEVGGWLFRDVRFALGYNFEPIPEYALDFLNSPIHRGVYFNLTGKFSRLFDLFGTPSERSAGSK